MEPQSSSPVPGTQLVHVGRQPIFDLTGDVVAYELLFRGRMDAVEAGRRDTYATSQVIVNTFTEFGIDEVVGDQTCFINMTREFLVGDLPLPFGPEHVVLEVLETVEVDDDVVDGVTGAGRPGLPDRARRLRLGLGPRAAAAARLVREAGPAARRHRATSTSWWPPAGRSPASRSSRRAWRPPSISQLSDRYGFELRQGYVLSRPQVLTAACLSPSQLRRLELVGALSQPDTDLETVLSIIAARPGADHAGAARQQLGRRRAPPAGSRRCARPS